MSSVSPSSSASQGQAGFVLSPPCVPDLGRLSEALSEPLVAKLWEQYYLSYQAYLGAATCDTTSDGYGSGSEATLSSVSSNSSRSAARRFRRARLRSKYVDRSKPVDKDGAKWFDSLSARFGYLRFVAVSHRPRVSAVIQGVPTVDDVLRFDWSSVDVDEFYSCTVRSVEMLGFSEGEGDGASLPAALAVVAAAGDSWPKGSVGALLSASRHRNDCGFLATTPFCLLGESDSGFCYSRLVLQEYRDRLAGLLGPSPTLARLVKCRRSLFLPDTELESWVLVNTRPGFLHVRRAEDGVSVCRAVASVVGSGGVTAGSLGDHIVNKYGRAEFGSYVGMVASSRLGARTASGSTTEIARSFNLYQRAVRPGSSSSLVVWLDVAGGSRYVPGSDDVGIRSDSHRAEVRTRHGRSGLTLSTPGRCLSVVHLPAGVCARYGDVEYGSRGVSTFLVFRRTLQVQLFACSGCAIPTDVSVLCEQSFVSESVSIMLDSKSTTARFIREADVTAVVLVSPHVAFGTPFQAGVVAVTDPLDQWKAIAVDRHEGLGILQGKMRVGSSVPVCCVSEVRSWSEASLVLNGCVKLVSSGARIAVIGYEFVVRIQIDDVNRGDLEWSFRKGYVADSYCMDRGGPSDSEYSDALDI